MTRPPASPRVSIVVPAYNPGPLLNDTLESIRRQTFTSWELVVVDDGSTEDLSWVETLDPRITRLRQPTNQGLSRTRNAGIAHSTADLVAFCDADDLWQPTKLQRQVARFDADPLLDLSHTAFDRVDSRGGYIGQGFTDHFRNYDDLLHGCGICVSTVVVRRATLERVGDFDAGLTGVQDWDLWLRVARHGRLSREDAVLAGYRVHPSSMSRNYRMTEREWKLVLRRHESPTAEADLRRLRQHLGGQAFDQARDALRARAIGAFVTSMAYSLLWAPRYTLRSTATYVGLRMRAAGGEANAQEAEDDNFP